ncbi:hypothetical protein CP973_07015 [Streptomyces albofaciens JCM 4342]|uniref:hypothetical protein n=1 Tax=Streptomyces albofaciens TaxID=66866 RepID=UPI00123AD26D|nr:hypothetical protein [Streptomyces albofaciens]KAA6221747.1 hypothetical protein CP973_07015 [Streptomyces albofaciens JCM 4342]
MAQDGTRKATVNAWQEESGGWLRAAVEHDKGYGRLSAGPHFAAGAHAAGTAAAVQWVEERYGPEAAEEIAAHITKVMSAAVQGPLDWIRLNRQLNHPPQS